MKRLTTTLSDELYSELLGYKVELGKRHMKRFSLGETVRSLMASRLNEERYEKSSLGLPESDRTKNGKQTSEVKPLVAH